MEYGQQPFYMTYPFLLPFSKERDQEREWKVMQSYYPPRVLIIQEKVEQECDKMEYDGSMMFDEYPDKFMMSHLCKKIESQIKKENDQQTDTSEQWEMDLIGVLLFNEMYRRRCKRRQYHPYF